MQTLICDVSSVKSIILEDFTQNIIDCGATKNILWVAVNECKSTGPGHSLYMFDCGNSDTY